MATSSASLDRSPGKNWVEESGGLPPGIRKVARKLKKLYPSWSMERCIATAQSMSEKWAARGSVKGARNVAGMQALRARNKARMAGKTVTASNPVLPHLELHLSNSYGTVTIPEQMLRECPADPLAVAMDQMRGSIFDLAQPADVAEWLDLAERRVRTEAGVKRFKKPIGSVISRGVSAPKVRTGADFVRAARKAQDTRQAKVSAAVDKANTLPIAHLRGALSKTSASKLAQLDAEYTRRAELLGKAGKVSRQHQAVKDARAEAARGRALERIQKNPTKGSTYSGISPEAKAAADAETKTRADQKRIAASFKVGAKVALPGGGEGELQRAQRRQGADGWQVSEGGAYTGWVSTSSLVGAQLDRERAGAQQQERRAAVRTEMDRRRAARQQPQQTDTETTALLDAMRRSGTAGPTGPRTSGEHPIMGQLRQEVAGAQQRAENDRQARALNLPGADGGRPKPDMSNVQGLSDEDLGARLAQAKTDLRKAFEQDPRRSSQGFKDAKLNADVLAAEKRRRNEADHNTRGQGKVSGVTTPTPTTSTPPARITPEQIQAGAPTPEIGKLGQDIANSRGAAMAQLLEGKNLEELRAADREMARRAEVLGRPGQVSPAHHALKKELAKKEADQAASDRIRADFERRVELGRTQTAAQPEQRAPSAAEQRITAERQAQQAIDARLTAIENRFRAMTPAQRKAAHDALMAERPKGMKQDAVLRRGQIRLELNVLERIAREERDPRPAADRDPNRDRSAAGQPTRGGLTSEQAAREVAAADAANAARDPNVQRTDAELDAMSAEELTRLQNRLLTTAAALPNSEWQERQRMREQADRVAAARARKERPASVTNLADRRQAQGVPVGEGASTSAFRESMRTPQPGPRRDWDPQAAQLAQQDRDIANVERLIASGRGNDRDRARLAMMKQVRAQMAGTAGKAGAAGDGGSPDAAIRDVYAQLAPEPGRWVGLTDLRRELSARGMSRQQVDRALEEMASTPGVHVSSEPNTKALTAEDRAAAVRFGGSDRHMLMIESDEEPDPWGPSGPPPGAVREQRAQVNRSALRAQGRAENDEWLSGHAETDAAEGFARARRASQDPRKVRGTAENITARQQARAAAASQPSMFAGTADEQRMADTEVRRTPARAPSLFDQPAEPERTPTVRAAEQEAQRAREAADDLPAHLTGDQRQMLTKQRQAADKAWAAARKVFDETGENPDAAGKRRRNRAAQKAADARDLYDRTAEAYGAPKLPPLQRTRPAGPRPRSTDEAAISAAKQELAEASQRAAANFNQRGGTLGGKKAKQITDARLRRSTEYGQKADRAKARLRALGVPEAEIEETVNAAWSR